MSYRPIELSPPESPESQTAGLVLVDDGRVLLEVRPVDARVYAGLLDLPGGHLEPDETPEQALVREAREELAIEVSSVRLLAVLDDIDPTSSVRYRHFIYLLTRYQGQVHAVEGQTLMWLPLDAIQRNEPLQDRDVVTPINPLARVVLCQCRHEGWI